MQNAKEEYLNLLKSVKREGVDKLIAWLEKSDFFTAPASTKTHNAFEGGLCEHSLNVYNRYKNLLDNEYGDNRAKTIDDETIILCSLLHDVCKANFYKVDYKNVKVDGNWVQKPVYIVDDSLPYGHGEKSVYIASGFVRLTREEAMIINWHMGGFDDRVKGGSYALANAFEKYPNALLFHIADMEATYLDELR